MAPTLVFPPFHRDGWVYEEKVDGWRMLAYCATPGRTASRPAPEPCLPREQIADVAPQRAADRRQSVDRRVQVAVLHPRERRLTDPKLTRGIALREPRLLTHLS